MIFLSLDYHNILFDILYGIETHKHVCMSVQYMAAEYIHILIVQESYIGIINAAGLVDASINCMEK